MWHYVGPVAGEAVGRNRCATGLIAALHRNIREGGLWVNTNLGRAVNREWE